MMMRLLAIGLFLLCGFSCQKAQDFFPVHGQVLVDEQPAEGAMVVLHPVGDTSLKALRPYAKVDANGSFAIRSYDPNYCPTPKDGAPVGEYMVVVNWFPPGAERAAMLDKLQNRYGNPETSGLRVQVKAEPNEVPAFRLTAKRQR